MDRAADGSYVLRGVVCEVFKLGIGRVQDGDTTVLAGRVGLSRGL